MKVTPEAKRAIWDGIHETRQAANDAADLLNSPEGRVPEQLEDVLNRLQEASFRARRAFGTNRGGIT